MATSHGKNAAISVDGTTFDTFANNTSMSRSVATAETTGFGVNDTTLLAGLESGTLSVSGPWDDATVDAALDGTFDGASWSGIFGPEGSTTGDVRHTASFLTTNVTITASNTQATQYSLQAARTGATTVDTYP